MTIEFANSGIASNFALNLKEKFGMEWVDTQTPSIYRILFSSIATYLKTNQTKTVRRSVFALKDSKGVFKIGAIMTYHKPEEDSEEDKGNWTLEFSLYEADTAEADASYDNFCDAFFMISNHECFNIMQGRFASAEYCANIFCECVDTLVDWLDTNARPDETMEITLPGVFTASVGIEKGKKVFAVSAGEIIRQMIKSDDIL